MKIIKANIKGGISISPKETKNNLGTMYIKIQNETQQTDTNPMGY